MSAGSPRRFPSAHQRSELDKFWSDPRIHAYLSRPIKVVFSFDIPDLAGYSKDGLTYYVDRHLAAAQPQIGHLKYENWIEVLVGSRPRHRQAGHEPAEKAAMDVWGYRYPSAHEDIATPCEHAYADAIGLNWAAEGHALRPWIKRTETERITRPPLDLDCSPYLQDPDANDIRVLARLAELGVKDAQHPTQKIDHKTAQYGRGHADGEHCGNCEHWEAPRCAVVADPMTYAEMGWSRLWSPVDRP